MFSFTFCPIFQTKNRAFVETFWIIFYFLVTYEEYDQHNDEKHNPNVKKKLGIRIVDLVQQGLGQVELQFVLMWVETLLITIKKRQKNNWDSYQFHKNYFQHICVPDPLLNSHALFHPLKQNKKEVEKTTLQCSCWVTGLARSWDSCCKHCVLTSCMTLVT